MWFLLILLGATVFAAEPSWGVADNGLRLGLSMHTDVNIRNQDGALLAAAPPAKPLLTTDAYAKQIAEAEARIEQIVRANLGRRG